MRLHLGCGKRDFGSAWNHIDLLDLPHIDSHNVEELPYDDNSCEIIYASHLINYFDRVEVEAVLVEWLRVLQPGGVLRLAVPDFEAMCNLYKNGYSLEKFLGPLYGKWNDPPIYHKTAYDFRSLSRLLKRVGFKGIKRYDWRDTDHAGHDDHSQAYMPHMDKKHGTLVSLNVEAVK